MVYGSAPCAPISAKMVSGLRGQSVEGLPDYFRIADYSPSDRSERSKGLVVAAPQPHQFCKVLAMAPSSDFRFACDSHHCGP